MMHATYGIGAYTPAEAGRLLGVPAATIRHWLLGYSYDREGSTTKQPPLWRPQYGEMPDGPLLGFRDLIEARIVRGLRSLGIGLPTIRDCLQFAVEVAGDDHPFSTRRLRTDGRTIFLEGRAGAESGLTDLKLRQEVFRRVVQPSFVDVDFDSDTVSRWWPLSRKTIVLDPARSFGQPIVAAAGVPTYRIAQAVAAEGSVDRVAKQFDIRPALVREAVAFEQREVVKLAA